MKIGKDVSNERGQVAIIVALLIISLLGMTALVIDMGSLYEERRFLQTIADSAALAGAQELPESSSKAIQVAIEYASNHGVTITSSDVKISKSLSDGLDDTITVTPVNPDAPLYFAKIFNIQSTEVGASATARVGKPRALSNLVPWGASIPEGVSWQDWLSTRADKILKFGAEDPNEGNFYALNLSEEEEHGGGASDYLEYIRNGYPGPLEVGDKIWTKTGNMAITVSATEERVGGPSESWLLFDDLVKYDEDGDIVLDKNNGQFVMVPVIYELEDPTGQELVEIVAFAPFILKEIIGHGGHAEIVGQFIDQALIVTEGGIDPVEPKGFRVIRLIR